MKKILITGSTDGIGLETAKALALQGHDVLIHGRSRSKLEQAQKSIERSGSQVKVEPLLADLSQSDQVDALAQEVISKHKHLDVLINNAGVYQVPNIITPEGLDIRFVVNTFAPYRLTQWLLPLLKNSARVVNIASAAQSAVDKSVILGQKKVPDLEAYAQSKLAITMWTCHLAREKANAPNAPIFLSMNPGSLLGTKMVKEGFGMAGNDIGIGVDILMRAALSEEFAHASGKYFDNDIQQFNTPHQDALEPKKCAGLVALIEKIYLSGQSI